MRNSWKAALILGFCAAVFVWAPSAHATTLLSGVVFQDLDGDGTQDGGEFGLADWLVYLDSNGNDQLDISEPTTTTDPLGEYFFENLAPGDYQIRQILVPGWELTAPLPLGYHDVTLGMDQRFVDLDFGVRMAVIPEPSSALAFMAGLTLTGAALRRRRLG